MTGIGEIPRRSRAVSAILRQDPCSTLVACTGDFFDLPAAYWACRQAGIHLVIYLFDDYVYQWTGLLRRLARVLAPMIFRASTAIIVTNETMAEACRQRYGVATTIIRNLCHIPNLQDLARCPHVFDEKTVNIVYTGSIYHAHYDAFRNLIAAIQKLDRADIRLHLYTSQPLSWLEQAHIQGPMIVYHEHISHVDIPTVLFQADVLFLPLAFQTTIPEVIKTSAPGKLGEYLAAGKPILVHAPPDTFVTHYFRQHECGVVVDQNDAGILAQALQKLLADPVVQSRLGQQARLRALADFDEARVRAEFVQLMGSVCNREFS